MKKLVRLTESDLHKIVNESVKKIMINELGDTPNGQKMLGRVSGRAYSRGNQNYGDEVMDYAENARNSMDYNGKPYDDNDLEHEYDYGHMSQYAYEEMMKDKDFLYKMASVYDAYTEGADDQQLLDAFGHAFELGDYRYRQ
jgi:hypothetical protein